MMNCWKRVPHKPRAYCIFNYNVPPDPESIWRLSLVLGDAVVILCEAEGWYYGHTLSNEAHKGVFPKTYVHLPESESAKDPIVEEINASLKEWNEIMKSKYLFAHKNDHFVFVSTIKGCMRDIISLRSSLAIGKLTEKEAREIRRKAVNKTDFLNKYLKLDLVVRDDRGNVISVEKTSAVSLYRHTVKKSEENETNNIGVNALMDGVHISNSFRIMLNVKQFSSVKVSDDVDLILSIYEVSEGKTPKPLCESYVIENWKKASSNSNNESRTRPLRVLFGDISKNDITDKKLFLICNVVSNGNFCSKAGNISASNEALEKIYFRKPVGVAAKDITSLFTFKQNVKGNKSNENELDIPFLLGNESECLDATFRKLISEKKHNAEQSALHVQLGIIYGDSGADLYNNAMLLYDPMNAYSYVGRVPMARKLGLPDVIRPSDVRNDLYVTVLAGDFSRLDKRQDRNVEVTMEVCDEIGNVVKDVISLGVGADLKEKSAFTSVVYYHEGKPRWNEVVRVTLPTDQFARCHLRFTFRHRSRRDEKATPWAFAYMKLVDDRDETAVKDKLHELLVYKIEKKVEVENTNFYLELPFSRSNMAVKAKTYMGLTPLPKDVFTVGTTLASTKLTQNEGLLSLLKWKSEPDNLKASLVNFDKKVTPQEFVKFMPDVLDALFAILMENKQAELFDTLVFKSLVTVILMITDENSRFAQFVPVLEQYIDENFYATLAYNKLLVVLRESVENATTKPKDLSQSMKCLRYIFKFVVRSRQLFSQYNEGKGQEPFEQLLKDVLISIVKLMYYTSADVFQAQGYCLKQVILAVPDLMKIYPEKDLAETIISMIGALPDDKLDMNKIGAFKDIVESPLFLIPNCRQILLPAVASHVNEFLLHRPDLVNLATETLGDILDKVSSLTPRDPDDITELMNICLRTVIKCVANRRAEDENMKAVVANMICLFDEMTPSHYSQFIDNFAITNPEGRSKLIDFIMEVLGLFKDLIANNVYREEWNTILMLQNKVVMKALCEFSHTIRDFFCYKDEFEFHAWNNFFRCAITFIKQPSLQLEKFSENKKWKILKSHDDMRKIMGHEVRQMWFNLGQHKIKFVPDLVGDFLEMALIPEPELRRATIPIFFDMIQCEFYGSRFQSNNNGRDSTLSKGHFHIFQNELISKLDVFIAKDGLGDDLFLHMYRKIMMEHCSEHTSIRDSGTRYVELTSKLIELLLEYRTTAVSNESKENQMSCIVNLLDFYMNIKRQDLYVRYLKEMAALHEKCQNHAESGHTILQIAKLLEWSDKPLDEITWEKYPRCSTNRALKEVMYKEVIDKFDEGKMWEKALEICKELCYQYEHVTFDYGEMATIMARMSKFYDNIMNNDEPRRAPEYFRVAFIGRGFPAFLQNKTFVYRGKGCDRLGDFSARVLDQFPNAEQMNTLNAPSEEERESSKQLVQINNVNPIMHERSMFDGKVIAPQILKYYKLNEVSQFSYSRPFHKEPRDRENEFASLWVERTIIRTRESFPGIMQWFPVLDPPEVFELTPLDNAIETMEKANESLRSMIQEHTNRNVNPDIKPLQMKLKGILDAAVMGGTSNYEKAFFTQKYARSHPEDDEKIRQLKDLIADQIPLLDTGIKIHDLKKSTDVAPLHQHFEQMFEKMKRNVEEKYGKRTCEFIVQRVTIHDRGGKIFEDASHKASFEAPTASNLSSTRNTLNNSLDLEPESFTRASFNSQSSIDSTPLSKAKNLTVSMIGNISRRKSNVSSMNRNDDTRGSTSSTMSHGGSQQANRTFESYQSIEETSTTVIVTDSRLYANHPTSRPSSGHLHNFISTSTPNHSRSPSMASNRDSVVSNEGQLVGDVNPPVLPPRKSADHSNGLNSTADTLSLSNFESNSSNSGSREDIVSLRSIKKKAPPPPPPIIVSNGSQTPPTPPKRPPLRPPTD